jgi:hypothetical protein
VTFPTRSAAPCSGSTVSATVSTESSSASTVSIAPSSSGRWRVKGRIAASSSAAWASSVPVASSRSRPRLQLDRVEVEMARRRPELGASDDELVGGPADPERRPAQLARLLRDGPGEDGQLADRLEQRAEVVARLQDGGRELLDGLRLAPREPRERAQVIERAKPEANGRQRPQRTG